ncbi:MAG: ACR3 family arsenite efflux transporter [Roseinatronobacter sp.]
MSTFERYLSVWVGLSILAGLALGALFPDIFEALAGWEIGQINLVIAVLIWVMIYPMMVAVDFAALARVHERPKGLIITLAVNWAVKPFTMAVLGIIFFEYVFAPFIAPETAGEYIAGLILLGAAPCTAMVFIWSQLTRGDPNYTLAQVSVNNVVMVVLYAPLVALLLGLTELTVPWDTLLVSVVLFVVVPLVAGVLTRLHLTRGARDAALAEASVQRFTARLKPFSVLGLLGTVVLLFGFQGDVILERPALIAMIAVPILIQSYGIFALAYAVAWRWGVPHNVAAPCALIGTSNHFELAVAVAIGLFGLNSVAALVTVVGVLVEVPVMLSLVWFANRTRQSFAA